MRTLRTLRTPRTIVGLAVLLNLWFLAPEARSGAPLNDGVLHLGLTARAAEALTTSESALDHWNPTWVLGFPVFQYYQHLPHLALAALSRTLGGRVELATLYNLTLVFVLAVFPIAMYFALRLFEFSPLAAAFAALCAPFLSSSGIGGFDYQSYVWRGSGMFTQAWGMSLFPLAVGAAWHTMRTGRRAGWAIATLAITMVSHIIYGYMAVLSIVALVFVPDDVPGPPEGGHHVPEKYVHGVVRRAVRAGFVLALVAIAVAYFLMPRALNGVALNRSVWEPVNKYDSYGHGWVLRALVTGDLLDLNRLPIVTLLASVGLAHALVRRHAANRVASVLFTVWLVLFFGRPTWGVLYRLLPLSNDLHLHRFIGGVHFAAIALAGLGLEQLFALGSGFSASTSLKPGRLGSSSRAAPAAATLALLAVILYPVARERYDYMAADASMLDRSRAALAEGYEELQSVLSALREHQRELPARVYAGLPGTWGQQAAIGNVPMYALLSLNGFDIVGYAYHAMSFGADVQYHFNDRNALHYEIFNVGWVVAPRSWTPPPFLSQSFETPHWFVYRAPTGGFFSVVDAPSIWLERPRDVYSTAVASLPSVGLAFAAHPGAATTTGIGHSGYRASVEAAQPGHLLFKMTHHPWWRATVDGQPQPIEWVAPGFMAVPIAAGSHQVAFEYRVPAYKAWLFWLGVLVLVGCLAFGDAALARVDRWSWARLPTEYTPYLPAFARGYGGSTEVFREGGKLVPTHISAAIVIGIAMLAGLPFLQERVLTGHDSTHYVARIASLVDASRAGAIVQRWATEAAGGYGSPWPLFVSPLHSRLGSMLAVIGFSAITATNLVTLATLLCAAIGMFLLVRRFFGLEAGVASAAALSLAPYTLVNLYARGDYAEFMALAFVPWLVMASLDLWNAPTRRRVIAVALLIALFPLTNLPATIVVMPFVAVAILAGLYRPATRKAAGALSAAVILALALSAFFWLPAAVERRFVHADRMISEWYSFEHHFVPIARVVYSPWRYDYNQFPDTGQTMTLEIGPIHLIVALFALGLLVWRWKGRASSAPTAGTTAMLAGSLGLLAIGAFMMTRASLPIWRMIPLLTYLQFPWRYLLLASLATAVLAAAPFTLVRTGTPAARILCASFLIVFVAYGYRRAKPAGFENYPSDFFTAQNYLGAPAATTSLDEFTPVWDSIRDTAATARRKTSDVTVASGAATVVEEGESRRLAKRWNLSVAAPATLRIHAHYFPGWNVTLDGATLPITITTPDGLMEVNVAAGSHRLALTKHATPIERAADLVSLAALFIAALGLAWRSSPRPLRTPDPV